MGDGSIRCGNDQDRQWGARSGRSAIVGAMSRYRQSPAFASMRARGEALSTLKDPRGRFPIGRGVARMCYSLLTDLAMYL